jgi:hypothetical protein
MPCILAAAKGRSMHVEKKVAAANSSWLCSSCELRLSASGYPGAG